MQAVFDKAKVILDGDTSYLCLAIPMRDAKRFVAEMKQDKYDVEIKVHRDKRSRNANNYLWQLLDHMGEVLGRPKEDLYLHYVRNVGPFKDFTLTEDEAKTFRIAWSKLGTGWPTEQVDYTQDGNNVVVRAYYGSSQYNTKQMSRLIDMVVDDAKSIGIETLTPVELARMKEAWDRGQKRLQS